MQEAVREFYHSSNGDRWLLVRNLETGRVSVRHEPNLPSGGKALELDVGIFLSTAPHSAECQSLLRLIGTLVPGNG